MKRKAEFIARDAIQKGLIQADATTRTLLGVVPPSPSPSMPLTSSNIEQVSTPSANATKSIDASELLFEDFTPTAPGITEAPSRPTPYQENSSSASSSALVELHVPRDFDVMSVYADPGSAVTIATNNGKPRVVTYDVLDMTLGAGYHTADILKHGDPFTRVVALDADHAVRRTAATLRDMFGTRRFQFFPHRMSECLTLFGDQAFDCVLIDPGPNYDQLKDPARGFLFDGAGAGDFELDMRYGPEMETPLHRYLQSFNPEDFADKLHFYGRIPLRMAHKFSSFVARSEDKIRTGSDLSHALDMVCPDPVVGNELEAWSGNVDSGDEQLRDDPWLLGQIVPASRRSFRQRILLGLRCLINNEHYELTSGLQHAMEVLKPEGRLVVLTREQWEHDFVKWFVDEHPYALLVAKELIDPSESKTLLQPPETAVWTITRTPRAATAVKNALRPQSADELQRSYAHWLSGSTMQMQTRGFPASKFGVGRVANADEAKARRDNARTQSQANNSRSEPVRLDRINRLSFHND